MDEFPGDDPDNLPKGRARSTCHEALERFSINLVIPSEYVGINGFGSLGRAGFCKAYEHFFIAKIPMERLTSEQAFSSKSTVKAASVQPALRSMPEGSGVFKLKDPSTGKTRTVLLSSESDPSQITWQDPERRAFHVIECWGKFTTVEQAFARIQTDYHTAEEARGALKVLIAAAATDAPRFYPGINLRDYRVEQNVFACAPPADSTNANNNDQCPNDYTDPTP
ncbi:hypothetical protein INS49_010881 [Diaporthe citri]|uniref:uncharacterized protein n=1 Tax=Diaporthe citri TaxID=83186 RepID=UPI001C802F3F|nr:uncharacterized protein INS49_010881 [Diaporthe citri]KAG6359828.1 hypothetical protein INS49_010881 [Diaporthe citri]